MSDQRVEARELRHKILDGGDEDFRLGFIKDYVHAERDYALQGQRGSRDVASIYQQIQDRKKQLSESTHTEWLLKQLGMVGSPELRNIKSLVCFGLGPSLKGEDDDAFAIRHAIVLLIAALVSSQVPSSCSIVACAYENPYMAPQMLALKALGIEVLSKEDGLAQCLGGIGPDTLVFAPRNQIADKDTKVHDKLSLFTRPAGLIWPNSVAASHVGRIRQEYDMISNRQTSNGETQGGATSTENDAQAYVETWLADLNTLWLRPEVRPKKGEVVGKSNVYKALWPRASGSTHTHGSHLLTK
ncbi:hypothetical protein GGR57DRAFT_504180 [Xylariaceae sp. FL1272]|nr:hypothetical protein GGR57DRAFT_504180 [Xylariaceae sp. FL1272]